MITIISFFTNNGQLALGLNPAITIREVDSGTLVVTGGSGDIMSELGNGWYKYEFDGSDSIDYAIVCDGGDPLTSAERYTYGGSEINSNLIETNDKISRILGLSQENYRILNPVYDNKGNLTSALIKTYSSATDTNNDQNSLAQYQLTASFNNKGLTTSYQVVKI